MEPTLKEIEEIYHTALGEESGQARAAYLSRVCGANTTLRAHIEALLQAHDEAGDFLEAPVLGPSILLDEPPVAEGPGTVIGRYKLLEKIGEGGMAVVYMAEQEQPIRRKVALKIIKLGMDTRQVIARFEAERQALALMDHPSIAKVLDAGSTETGRPYFVMELVQGVSITQYCDGNSLSTKDRLALFVQVCNAVQHAHQKGIIHRDIKPSNVMVTHHDGRPVPKVIDFGIAKATNQRLTEKTLFTRYAHIVGTPAYMSPEQAELSDLDIDTRSDIYSLGVLLYELLTGTTPFSEEELRKAGYVEMQRVIREQEPAKPSTKLSTLGETLTDIAKHRNSTPDLLRKAIRGDLDWIVMKSLEKDRLRRYEAPEALALDIQRHLEHRPVVAHAPSRAYRLHKFLRRHRLPVIGGLTLALLVGALASVFFMWNQNRLRLVEAEVIRHRDALSRAHVRSTATEYGAALEILEPLLGSKHVGAEARLLHDEIQEAVRRRIGDYTREIEADPTDAHPYYKRARYYDYIRDRANANADMTRWSVVQRQRPFWDSWFGQTWDLEHVINLPSDRQIVLSAERPDNETPVMSVAFGQKGRGSMRSFKIPMSVTSLVCLWLLSGFEAPLAYGDFTVGRATNLGPSINTASDDAGGTVSADGCRMYFGSGQPGGYGGWDMYTVTRQSKDDEWGPVVHLGPAVNSSSSDAPWSISADGLSLYFGSSRPGGYGDYDIWVTTRATTSAPWGAPVNLGPTINGSDFDGDPSISADGLSVYFDSRRPGGSGRSDLWVSVRTNLSAPWGPPINLGPSVNSANSDHQPSISADGLKLFFASGRLSSQNIDDIYVMTRATVSSPWSTPVNLGPQINTPDEDFCPSISPDGSMLYFASTRPGGYGGYDIWQAPVIPIIDFNGDGKVDGKEVLAMADNWGQNKSAYDIGPTALGDGLVDVNDLVVLADYIGTEWVDPTLLAHWALDEVGGSVAMDWGGEHDAMITGTVVWQPDGIVGGALAFDGKENFMRTVTPVLDPAKGPFSVISWVKGGAPNRVVVSQASGADWLYLNQFGMLTTDLKASGRDAKSLTSDAFVTDDQWHRVAVVWDGTNRALHMDGVEVARDTQPSLAASGGSMQIGGGKNVAPTTLWTGLIDDVRIYNRAVQP